MALRNTNLTPGHQAVFKFGDLWICDRRCSINGGMEADLSDQELQVRKCGSYGVVALISVFQELVEKDAKDVEKREMNLQEVNSMVEIIKEKIRKQLSCS